MEKLHIEVRTIDNIRTMYIEGKAQSAMDVTNPTLAVFDYTKYFYVPLCLIAVKRALFIGGGGFSGPKIYAHHGIAVDAVEVNQEVVDIAKRQFALDTQTFNVFVEDGRAFLTQCSVSYDAIILDAFIAEKVPLQFTTFEFFTLVRKHLSENGLLVFNVISAPELWFFQSLVRTLSSVFASVLAFDLSPAATQTRNIIIIASPSKLNPTQVRKTCAQSTFDLAREMELFIENVQTRRGEILRDS
ncbi:MAG TPA: fused MFS/spermidine synthase [Acidobacteriota bacterium]|nr:fused MFS/spermidine synthase [Acidobacteriota bacterium]